MPGDSQCESCRATSCSVSRQAHVFQSEREGVLYLFASEVARERISDQDITVRGAISIGRRLWTR